MCVCMQEFIYTSMSMHLCVHIYIYMYLITKREREGKLLLEFEQKTSAVHKLETGNNPNAQQRGLLRRKVWCDSKTELFAVTKKNDLVNRGNRTTSRLCY